MSEEISKTNAIEGIINYTMEMKFDSNRHDYVARSICFIENNNTTE